MTTTISSIAAISLTQGQEAALQHLLDCVDRGVHASLIGAAGTGKTTLLGTLIDRLQRRGMVTLCATPTHKAASVVRSKIPAEVEVTTVASLLGLKPQHRGKVTVFVADWNAAKKRERLKGVGVLLVDESSMVGQALASDLVRLADEFGTTVVFIGDAAQLPPVEPEPEPEPGEELTEEEKAAAELRGRLAEAFIHPPGGAAILSEVVRHQGPVLELATRIRGCSNLDEINRQWPRISEGGEQSFVRVWQLPTQWLDAACQAICHPSWESDPDSARIVAWTNRSVASFTSAIRNRKYGADAVTGWQVGEIVANGDAVQQPGQSLSSPLAPSSCEWRIDTVENVDFNLTVEVIDWHTPAKELERTLVVGAAGLPMQRLQLVPLFAGRSQQPITVLTPRSGDRAWHEAISELRRKIAAIPPDQKTARKEAWKAWHNLKSHCADVRSAAVLTTHRSQGSTFSQVWIAPDLAWCTGADAVPLTYTALTRASVGLHLLGRG